jgi:SPP1 gp7 family putative phage head morphogenesis protein
MLTLASVRAAAVRLAPHGYTQDHAASALFQHVRPRFDVDPRPHAAALAHRIANARKFGTVARRRRVPRQQYPMALEAAYATRIIDMIRAARSAYDRLVVELPKLLVRAHASRGDDVQWLGRYDAAADTEAIGAELERVKVAGFDVVIENPAGSTRTWIEPDGTTGSTLMRYPYGFIARAMGADGEPVDVYVGPDPDPAFVFVVHQRAKADGFGTYDEDKVMLGWSSADAAREAYLAQYNDPRFFGGMSVFTIDDFRAALASREASKDTGIIAHRADSGELEFAKHLVDEAGRHMRAKVGAQNAEKLAQYFARETSQAQRRELARQLTAALGVEVLPDEQHIPQMLEYFTHENATLISSIPDELHREVASLTARAFTKRMNPDTFAAMLQERFDIAEGRARFIARDQLGKLWGQLNAYRQRGVGITEFIWRTRRDDRVRPSHRKLEGKTISFTDLPPFGLPGEDYGCRCTGDPIVDGILDAAAELAAHQEPSQTLAGTNRLRPRF